VLFLVVAVATESVANVISFECLWDSGYSRAARE